MEDGSELDQISESEQTLKRFISQYCNPEQFQNNKVSGSSSILNNISSICVQNHQCFQNLAEQNRLFLEKFSKDWTELVNKFCSNNFYSKNAGMLLHASISLVKNLTEKDISLVVESTNWEALVFTHLEKLALKRYYIKDYLVLTRKFLCYRYAARSPDVKQHINLMGAVFKCIQNDSKRVSLYAALNLYAFSPELQFAPEFRYEMGHVHELGREIFGKVAQSLNEGSPLQDREIYWLEEINMYLKDLENCGEKRKHLIRQIGDYLVETNFLVLVGTTLDHVVSRPSSDGNVLKLLAGTFNVSGMLQIVWTLDESLLFSHYFHHTNIATKLARLFDCLLTSGISRKDYDKTINEILKSVRLNCLNATELKAEFYEAQILTVFEKNLQVLLQKQSEIGAGTVFVTIYITAILGNSEEVADCLQNKSNVKVLSNLCDTLVNNTNNQFKIEIDSFGVVDFAEVVEVLLAYERDKGLKMIAETAIVDNLLKVLEIENFSKSDSRNVALILFTLSLVELTQETLIRKNMYNVCLKVKKEINDAFTLRCLNGILWQLSGTFDFQEYELSFPENSKISVFVSAAEKDQKWRKKYSEILALKGFEIKTEESIKALQLQIATEFDPSQNETTQDDKNSEKREKFLNLNMNKDAPLWSLAISESHLVIVAMSKNLEEDKFSRMQLQFTKQLGKDLRFIDVNELEYNPQNWLFDLMQRCMLYDSINQIKLENVQEQLKKNKENENPNNKTEEKRTKASNKSKERVRRQSLIDPASVISQGGITLISQWSRDDVQKWLDLIKVPKAKEPFGNLTGIEISDMKQKCQQNAKEFGRYLRDTFDLDLYSQKQIKNSLMQM